MYAVIFLFIFIFGTVIGSFLSVVIFRLPNSESIVWGRSKCPKCHKPLSYKSLIPVVSYVIQSGRCTNCHSPISSIYPFIELVTASLFIFALYLSMQVVGPIWLITLTFVYLCVLFAVLVALTFIDFIYFLLPDVLVFLALGITAVYHILLFGLAYYLGNPGILPSLATVLYGYAFGFAVALFFFMLILATKGKGMGGGDVKYALVLGAAAGWPNAVVAIFTAFVSGAVISLILIALKKKTMKQTIPFGPFLIFGTIVGMVYGRYIIDFYLQNILG